MDQADLPPQRELASEIHCRQQSCSGDYRPHPHSPSLSITLMSKSPYARFVLPVWTNIRAFAGFDQPATPMLWTRWLYLRALGLLFIVIFGCTLKEQAA